MNRCKDVNGWKEGRQRHTYLFVHWQTCDVPFGSTDKQSLCSIPIILLYFVCILFLLHCRYKYILCKFKFSLCLRCESDQTHLKLLLPILILVIINYLLRPSIFAVLFQTK
jgi:hypothetical protein